ncbi:MAG: transketolase [Oscillospiraceae bacterium]|nr:transketolase [Oscillospiraceae bacterium]
MKSSVAELREAARLIRRDIIDIAYLAEGPSHPGPALSIADILAALYFRVMDADPRNPGWAERDRLVLSKGHACPAVYAALAGRGYFDRAWLTTVRRLGSRLQGHPDMNKTPGIDITSGSLGNGLSLGLGIALALRLLRKNCGVFVILGDGELQEGMIWEAVMAASAQKADNLTAIVDYNHFQSCGGTDEIVPLEPMRAKWESFNWNVFEINGHDMEEIVSRLEMAKRFTGRPTVIIAHTVKGKGVSFMEADNSWHQRIPSKEQYDTAMRELAGGSE